MMPLSPKVARYAATARSRYGKLTPFRLGIVVGEQSDAVRVPWTDEHSLRLYREGLEAGADLRRRFDAQADRNPEGHDPVEGHGRNDESPVLEEDAPRTNLKDNSHG